jgi:hypothetical protein
VIYTVYFNDAGVPKTGLSPTIITYKKVSDGSDVASPPAVSTIGGGGYKFAATPTEALFVVVDGGAGLSAWDRYKVMQITPNDAALDAQVSTRAAEAGGNVAAIKAKTDNLPGDPASNTQVNTRLAAADYVAPDNTGITAVKAKTDNLPPDPADQSAVETALTAAISSIKGVDGDDLKIISEQIDGIAGGPGGGASAADIWTYASRTLTAGPKDAEIDAIKAKTDGLPADPASQGAVLAAIAGLSGLTVGELLAGDLSDHLSFPVGSLADLLRKLFWTLCNRLVINDATGEFTAYKSDGVTPAVTGAIAADGATTERRAPAWP